MKLLPLLPALMRRCSRETGTLTNLLGMPGLALSHEVLLVVPGTASGLASIAAFS